MDSRSSRPTFCLSSPRPSYSSSSVSSSSLGSSRLYRTDPSLSSDRFTRALSVFKSDSDQQRSPLRDYGSRSSSWRLPSSLTSSTRAYDRPWAESPLTSRNKVGESEGRLGTRSTLLNTVDDGDSKRAKLTSAYSNRGLNSQTASTSFMGSSLSSGGSRVTSDKEKDSCDWRSSRLLSRQTSSSSASSSKPLFSRRELEATTEPSYSGLGARRTSRTTGLNTSLYQTDRVTSTYAQGARPKETSYAPTSPMSRESCHLLSSTSSHSPSRVRDLSSRSTNRIQSSYESTPRAEPTSESPTSSSQRWYSSASRTENSLSPRPGPEIEGRSSTRRLFSRLFSRRSSQDSSGSSSVRSIDEDGPSTESVASDEALPNVDPLLSESVTRRQHRVMYNPLCESNNHCSGLAPHSDPPVTRNGNTNAAESNSPSWLSSSIRSRCPPLLARLRRYAREESGNATTNPEYTFFSPYLREEEEEEDDDEEEEEEKRLSRVRRYAREACGTTATNPEYKFFSTPYLRDEEVENDEKEEEKQGAVGSRSFESDLSQGAENEVLPDLEEVSQVSRRRLDLYQNIATGLLGSEGQLGDHSEKLDSTKYQEKLCKIKERLLMEDSDEEEGDLCRICQMGEVSATNPLIQPCRCTGSLQYVHQDCIKRWLHSKISSGTNLEGITTCELCKDKLLLNLDNFDLHELYRSHVQSEYDDFISSGLYLVVLLHFCEQRFSDVLGAVDATGLFNLVRILTEHMDRLENGTGEGRDNRPSIEFSDLDDDLEEYS